MEKTKHLNNEGFSLIEFILAIAISTMVIATAFGIITYGMQSYNKTTKNSKLQSEIQFTGNFISDAIKSGQMTNSYLVIHKDGTDVKDVTIYTSVELDSSDRPVKNADGTYRFKKQAIYYNAAKKSVYVYDQGETIGTGDDNHLVSKYVTGFDVKYCKTTTNGEVGKNVGTIDATTGEESIVYAHESDLIQVDIDFEISGTSKHTTNTYKIRNK